MEKDLRHELYKEALFERKEFKDTQVEEDPGADEESYKIPTAPELSFNAKSYAISIPSAPPLEKNKTNKCVYHDFFKIFEKIKMWL